MNQTVPFPDGDIFDVQSLLTEQEREKFQKIRQHLQGFVRPNIVDFWNKEEFPFDFLPKLAELGLGELALTGESWLFRGLVYAEVTRADVSLSALVGIHNELIVGLIDQLGSEEQKAEWLPQLRQFKAVGSFALTEPEHGSDIAGGLEMTATPTEDGGWVLNGEKRWIGAGTFADFIITWAKDTSDGQIKGFLVRSDSEGFSTEKIVNKIGLRVMQNAHITMDNVKVGQADLMPGADNFAAANEMLRNSRIWVGWQGYGAQMAAFDVAREYALERKQFGRPLAKFQLVQQGIAEIISNAQASLGIMMQVARLQESGNVDMVHAAMGKATGSRLLRESAAIARNLLGGNGIISDYQAAKVFSDAEVIHTYEGTYEINSLIVSRAVTGVSAFV